MGRGAAHLPCCVAGAESMTEIGFDSQALGISTLDDQSANVSGPMSAYCVPAMMRRKFIGDTTQKVVYLSHIYRMPGVYGRGFTESAGVAHLEEPRLETLAIVRAPQSTTRA